MLRIVDGIGKRLEIHPDRIIIKRTDLLATFVPAGFSREETVLFTEMSGVHMRQPDQLRLDDCEAGCVQLVITRADHSHVSLMLKASQVDEAQAVREHLTAQIGLAQR